MENVSYVIHTCVPVHWFVYVMSVTMVHIRAGALYVVGLGSLMLTIVKNVLYKRKM